MKKIELFAIAYILVSLGVLTSCGSLDNISDKKKAKETNHASEDEDLDKLTEKNNSDATILSDNTKPDKVEKDDADQVLGRDECVPAALKVSFATIPDVISHINKLPLPLTIPCLIDSLPKPLRINATNSALSVQPAAGSYNPRIFIFVDNIILTFVPVGKGSETVEFSELRSDTSSVKGEISFPVTEILAEDSAYKQIMRKDGYDGTTCVGCHMGEDKVSDQVFETRALKPFVRQDVPLPYLEELKNTCVTVGRLRCDIFDALFKGKAPLPIDFPDDMPTLF
jgi:hypothetical protein